LDHPLPAGGTAQFILEIKEDAEVSMTNTRLRVFAITALLSIAGAALGDNGPDQTLRQISGYREWTRLTPKPVVVAIPSGGLSIGDVGG
jgi:hypothetical protein